MSVINRIILSSVIISVVLCTQKSSSPQWNNPLDADGTNYFPPTVELPPPFAVRWDEEASITITAKDSNGTIEHYIWKTSADMQWDTTHSPELKIQHPEGGKVTVTAGAIDNDGIRGFAETSILFNRRPEQIEIDYPYNGKQHIFDEIEFTDTIGTIIAFGLQATDPDGADDSLRYAIEVIDTVDKTSRIYNDVSDSIWLDSLYPGHNYRLVYKAFDRHGDSITAELVFRVQDYFPKGMVFFPREPEYEIHHPFWIDTAEVTIEEYATVLGNSYDTANGQIPVSTRYFSDWSTELSYLPDFLKKLNGTSKPAIGFRVPYQKELSRAYKNPVSEGPYFWGSAIHQDIVKRYAWYSLNAKSSEWTIPHAENDGLQVVAQLLPNEYGLYDLSGNVAESIITAVHRREYNLVSYGHGYCIGGDVYSTIQDLSIVRRGAGSFTYEGFRKVYGQVYQ